MMSRRVIEEYGMADEEEQIYRRACLVGEKLDWASQAERRAARHEIRDQPVSWPAYRKGLGIGSWQSREPHGGDRAMSADLYRDVAHTLV